MLAQREMQNNNKSLSYLVQHPVCERHQQLMDRNLESQMMYTEGTTLKKHCLPIGILHMNHGVYTLDQSGPWVDQHAEPIFDQRFDTWTRAKGGQAPKF